MRVNARAYYACCPTQLQNLSSVCRLHFRLFAVILLARAGKGATHQLTSLLTNCATRLWERNAVLADVRPWGVRDLAYRIRKQGVNHYQAQYVSLHVFCSPPTLKELEKTLQTEDHVLRFMSLRQKSIPPLDVTARFPNRPKPPNGPIDLEADPTERAKWEYRNLVMQRVFEGRTKQELVAEQLLRHRFQAPYHSPTIDHGSEELASRGPLISSLRPESSGGKISDGGLKGPGP